MAQFIQLSDIPDLSRSNRIHNSTVGKNSRRMGTGTQDHQMFFISTYI